MPAEKGLGGTVLATVFMIRADVVPPGLNGSGEPFNYPHARLGFWPAGHSKSWVGTLIHSHRLRDEFVPAQQAVDKLAHVAVALKAHGVVTRLGIEEYQLRPFADSFIIPKSHTLS